MAMDEKNEYYIIELKVGAFAASGIGSDSMGKDEYAVLQLTYFQSMKTVEPPTLTLWPEGA